MTRLEFGAATSTGNVHRTYPTREAAQAFADEQPVPMHILLRDAGGARPGRWMHA